MPGDPQPLQARKTPCCRRCQSELQRLVAVPKRAGAPAFEVFRCVRCAEVQWVEGE